MKTISITDAQIEIIKKALEFAYNSNLKIIDSNRELLSYMQLMKLKKRLINLQMYNLFLIKAQQFKQWAHPLEKKI